MDDIGDAEPQQLDQSGTREEARYDDDAAAIADGADLGQSVLDDHAGAEAIVEKQQIRSFADQNLPHVVQLPGVVDLDPVSENQAQRRGQPGVSNDVSSTIRICETGDDAARRFFNRLRCSR